MWQCVRKFSWQKFLKLWYVVNVHVQPFLQHVLVPLPHVHVCVYLILCYIICVLHFSCHWWYVSNQVWDQASFGWITIRLAHQVCGCTSKLYNILLEINITFTNSIVLTCIFAIMHSLIVMIYMSHHTCTCSLEEGCHPKSEKLHEIALYYVYSCLD